MPDAKAQVQTALGTSEEELRTFQKQKLELEIQDLARSSWTKPATWFNLVGVLVASAVAATGWIFKSIEVEGALVDLRKAEVDLKEQEHATAVALRERDAALTEKVRAIEDRDEAFEAREGALAEATRARSEKATLVAQAERAKGEASASLELAKQAQAKVTTAQEELTALQGRIEEARQKISPAETAALEYLEAAAESVSDSLKRLTLPSEATDADLDRLLQQNPNVVGLDMNFCTLISDAGLALLADHQKLQELSLLGCTGVTDAGMASIGQLTNLTKLILSWTPLGDAGLKHLGRLTKLELLLMDDCDAVSGDGLASLQALPIRHLSLSFTQIGDRDLGQVAHIATVTNLSLFYSLVTDAGLSDLAALPQLEMLSLQGCNVGDEGLGALSSTKLRSLTLYDCPRVTCTGLTQLKALPMKSGSPAGLVEARTSSVHG